MDIETEDTQEEPTTADPVADEPEAEESVTAKSEEEATLEKADIEELDRASEAASQKRKRVIAASVAAFLLVCLVVLGAGVANGWFVESDLSQTAGETSDHPQAKPPTTATSTTGASHSQTSGTGAAAGTGSSGSTNSTGSAGNAGTAGNANSTGSAGSQSSNSSSNPGGAGTVDPAPPIPDPVPEPSPEPAYITVSVYVDSSNAASLGYPACLASTSVTLYPGASVYDALVATGVGVGGSSDYVRSIGGLAEFQAGPTSGWTYSVNGYSPGYGCGSYLLYGGESIYWCYVLSY